MYAVIKTGGKQYKVAPGETIAVEKLQEEAGKTLELDQVLLIVGEGNAMVGQPVVAGAKVVAEVARQGRGDKIIVFKYKPKKRYRRTTGHRQDLTFLKITDIIADGKSLIGNSAKAEKKAPAKAAAKVEKKVEEPVASEEPTVRAPRKTKKTEEE